MKKLLITGINGFLGWALYQQAQGWQVFGTVFSHEPAIADAGIHRVDLRDLQQVNRLFDHVLPDAVIHTAAMSAANVCQLKPELSYAVNVRATVNIARCCARSDIPLVFTSTDLVFDGLDAPYCEEDPVGPVNIYGKHKVLAEEHVLSSHRHASVCRLPLLFGISGPVEKGLVPLLANMKKNKPMYFFVDEYRTPVSNRTAAQGLLLVLGNFQGLIHLGGRQRISRYEFAELVAESFNVDNAVIEPVLLKDVEMAAPRAPDVSLNSRLAASIGYQPPELAEELSAIAAQMRFDTK